MFVLGKKNRHAGGGDRFHHVGGVGVILRVFLYREYRQRTRLRWTRIDLLQVHH